MKILVFVKYFLAFGIAKWTKMNQNEQKLTKINKN